jgi:hypothetical protein
LRHFSDGGGSGIFYLSRVGKFYYTTSLSALVLGVDAGCGIGVGDFCVECGAELARQASRIGLALRSSVFFSGFVCDWYLRKSWYLVYSLKTPCD